jgi:hypothetical protein
MNREPWTVTMRSMRNNSVRRYVGQTGATGKETLICSGREITAPVGYPQTGQVFLASIGSPNLGTLLSQDKHETRSRRNEAVGWPRDPAGGDGGQGLPDGSSRRRR